MANAQPTIRIRQLRDSSGAMGTLDVTTCYTEYSRTFDANTVDTTTSCVTGTREEPTNLGPEWSFSFPWATASTTLISTLTPGNVISFEVCKNPGATTTLQRFEVITYTTVKADEESGKVKDVLRKTVRGAGGDGYAEQTGRTGLPAPFNAAT